MLTFVLFQPRDDNDSHYPLDSADANRHTATMDRKIVSAIDFEGQRRG